MVKIGDKIVPRMGSYKGRTLIVRSKGKVVQGNRHLGTKTGQMIYFASPKNSVSPAFYGRKDFKIKKSKTK